MTEQEKQQQLKREFEKDSTLVTPSMRELHFEKFGMYSDDKVILAWHNSNKVTSEMRELHRKEFGIAGAYDSDAQILAWYNSQLKEHPASKAYQEAVEPKSKTQEMRKIYEANPDKWVAYHNINGAWHKTMDVGGFGAIRNNSILIAKEHEHIADAVIANPDVEVEFTWVDNVFNGAILEKSIDFFNHYDISKWDYRLAEPKCDGRWNGYYIEASQEAYDKLLNLGYEQKNASKTDNFIVVMENKLHRWLSKSACENQFKLFHLVNGEFTEIAGEEDERDNTDDIANIYTGDSIGDKRQTISVKDEQGKDITRVEVIGKTGREFSKMLNNSKYEISIQDDGKTLKLFETPIKEAWYKNEDNFPALIVANIGMIWVNYYKDGKVFDYVDRGYLVDNSNWRLATKEEVMSLYYDGKEL